MKERQTPLDVGRDVKSEILLGLGSRDARLELAKGARCLDINPWMLDCVAVRVTCLGHQEELPRSWDWENVLTLLEPGEELLYVLDHVGNDGDQTGQPFTLWLAIRFPRTVDMSASTLNTRRQRSRVLMSQFQRQAFPGSDIDWVDPEDVHALLDFETGGQPRGVCVSGMPSPRAMQDDRIEVDRSQPASRNYQSLNDVAESLVDLPCDYRLALVVKRVADSELREALGWATTTRDAVHPFVKSTRESGKSDTRNKSKQNTESSGGSKSAQDSEGRGPLKSILKALRHPLENPSHRTGTSAGRTWSKTTAETSGSSKTQSSGQSHEEIRSLFELADRSLERTIAALHEAHGTGGYRWAAFVLANGDSADLIGGAVEGVLAGSRTKDHPLNRFEIRGAGPDIFQSSLSLIDLVSEAAPILPLPRVCDALLLPEAELPGVRLRRNVFFGRTCSPPHGSGDTVRLGPDAFSAIGGAEDPAYIEIPRSDLFRHVLVAGTTGSGKTTRVVEILNGLKDDTLSVVVFETAKRTYRHQVKRVGRDAPLIYTLGSGTKHADARIRPLRINPFFFELGTSLKRHIAVLADALAELMPTEAMIGPLMRRAVEAAYKERGWDIERGRPLQADLAPSWPTVLDFVAQVRTLAHALNYGPEVTANYRGALENRAALFVDAAFEDIFSHGGNTPIDELFPPGCDAIIEVDHLPPSEVDVRAFVMTLLLDRLRATQAVRHERFATGVTAEDSATPRASGDQVHLAERRWLVVVEEAHNVLERSFEERRPSDESNAGRTLLRCINRLLQEGREIELGLMVVDQSPRSLARSVISNTGTKVVMRLEDGAEMEEIGQAMGLDEDAWQKLGYLQEGEAVIKASYMDAPVKTAPFSELSDGPPRDENLMRSGWTPSYTELENRWRPVLAGTQEPSEDWRDELLSCADGSSQLAVFVGLKLQLAGLVNDPQAATRSRVLRHMVANADLGPEMLLNTARSTYREAATMVSSAALLGVERLLFRALAGAPDPEHKPLVPVVALGINRAAEILENEGLGRSQQWKSFFARLASGLSESRVRTLEALKTYAHETGNGDETACLQVLLRYRAEALQHPSPLSVVSGESVELLLQVARLVAPVAARHTDDVLTAEAASMWDSIQDRLHRQTCLALARQCGDDQAAEVSELLGLN